jgi:hypothetical protein
LWAIRIVTLPIDRQPPFDRHRFSRYIAQSRRRDPENWFSVSPDDREHKLRKPVRHTHRSVIKGLRGQSKI